MNTQAVLAPDFFPQLVNITGTAPAVGFKIFTYVAGTSTKQATYLTSTISVGNQNTNPILCSSDGGYVMWMDPSLTYKVVLAPANDTDPPTAPIKTIDNVNTSQYLILPFYPQTPAELVAGVTPTALQYPPGTVDRYGTNTVPGTTDMTAAIKAALSVQRQSPGIPIQFLANLYLVTDTCLKLLSTDFAVVIQGIPQRTIISNKAAASHPTIQLLGTQYWTIQGLVLIGNTGFINHGIELLKDGSSNRTAFGTIRDIVAQTNGIGCHIQDTNTVFIDRFDYWPTSASAYGGTVDIVGGSNNQPGGVVADGTGSVNDIHVRSMNASGVTTIANGGAAVKIDGTAAGTFFDWSVDSLLSERSPASTQRALWVRNVTGGRFTNLFTENNDITIDTNSVACTLDTIEAGNTGTVNVSGTSTQITLRNCVARTLTIDSSCSYVSESNNQWGTGGDNNSASKVFSTNVTSNGVDQIERIGNAGLSFGQKPGGVQTLTANGQTITIGTAGTNYTTISFTSSGAFTGLILPVGIVDGQIVLMKNISGNDATFAVAGTSHVADGVSCVIKGLTARMMVWDVGSSLWYSVAASVV